MNNTYCYDLNIRHLIIQRFYCYFIYDKISGHDQIINDDIIIEGLKEYNNVKMRLNPLQTIYRRYYNTIQQVVQSEF